MSAEATYIDLEVDATVETVEQLQTSYPDLIAEVEDALTPHQKPERPKIHPNYPKNAVGLRHSAQWWENRRKFERRIV